MIYKMALKDSVDTMTFNLLETPIVDKDIEGAVDNVTLDGNQYTDYIYLKKQYIQKWAIMCPDEYDELRGFYTRQFEDSEVPSYRVYYGANVTRDYTLNGDYFQFNAEGIETGMTLSQLTGNTEQTTYSGKNKVDGANPTDANLAAVSLSNDIVTVSSTSTTTFPYARWVIDGISQNDVIRYSAVIQDNNGQIALQYDNNGSWVTLTTSVKQYTDGTTPATYSWTNTVNTTKVRFLLYANKSIPTGSSSSRYKNVILTVNNLDLSYEPYVGGIPAPNPSYPQPISTVTGEQTVKITGKNLLSITADSVLNQGTYVSGANTGEYKVKATGNDLFINAASTAGTFYTNTRGNLISCNYGETIYFNVGNANFQKNYFTEWDKDMVSLGYTLVSSSSGTYTPANQNCKYVNFRFGNGYSVPDTTYTLSPIVCKTSDTSFESYQGQSQEINLGKNLWGGFTYTWTSNWNFDTIFNEDGSFSISGNASENSWSMLTANALSSACIKLEAGTYTFIFSGTASRTQLVSVRPDGTGEIAIVDISATSGAKTFTLTETRCLYPRMRVLAGNTSLTEKCMIQASSQVTSYAPYFTPIELAKVGNYQDRIYKNDGKWYIEKQVGKVVLNGSENWSLYPNKTHTFRVGAPHTITNAISDHFTSIPSSQFDVSAGAYTTNTGVFIISYPDMADVASFKTWLANNPTTFYCAGAQWATTTEITDETLRAQLNFLASLYEGENNISLVGTGAQGEMEVFIRDVMSVETDVVPEVPVRLTLTDDGVINACGCRRNVQLTMRETTE